MIQATAAGIVSLRMLAWTVPMAVPSGRWRNDPVEPHFVCRARGGHELTVAIAELFEGRLVE